MSVHLQTFVLQLQSIATDMFSFYKYEFQLCLEEKCICVIYNNRFLSSVWFLC